MEIEPADSRLQAGPPTIHPEEGDHPEVAAAIYAMNTGVCRDYYGDLLEHDNGIVKHFTTIPKLTPRDVTNQ